MFYGLRRVKINEKTSAGCHGKQISNALDKRFFKWARFTVGIPLGDESRMKGKEELTLQTRPGATLGTQWM